MSDFMRGAKMVFALAVIGLLVACEPGGRDGNSEKALAWVNGEPVTDAELAVAMEGMFGRRAAEGADEAMRARALESLVQSRAIATMAADRLPPEEVQSRRIRARLREDELLAQAYLRHFQEPLPVTVDMARRYYRENPGEFGAGERRRFEMLLVTEDPTREQRRQLITAFEQAPASENWHELAADLASQGLPVIRHVGVLGSGTTPKALESNLKQSQAGDDSGVVIEQGRPFIARLTQVETVGPRPYDEVRGEIRQRLTSVRVQQALEKAAEEAAARVEIQYRDDVIHEQ